MIHSENLVPFMIGVALWVSLGVATFMIGRTLVGKKRQDPWDDVDSVMLAACVWGAPLMAFGLIGFAVIRATSKSTD